MVEVSQRDRDALVVRGYLAEEERDNGAHSKRRLRAYSQIWRSYSPKPLTALELASDRQIQRNASQAGGPWHGLRVTVESRSDGHASPG
jgi:hypothetical protein